MTHKMPATTQQLRIRRSDLVVEKTALLTAKRFLLSERAEWMDRSPVAAVAVLTSCSLLDRRVGEIEVVLVLLNRELAGRSATR
jgi:hypothetical protein